MFTITIEDQNGQVADSFSFDHGSYTIGRLEECDVVLPSSSVSRKHARIFIEDGRCYVEDLGSANGIIVDGQRVVQTRDLGTASQIRIGEYYLYLEYQRQSGSKKQNVMSTLFIDSGSEHHKLVRVNDSFAGEEFSLSEQENTIGRTDDNFILLSGSSISRHHAVIHRRADLYAVEDRGSSNGTRVNGKDVDGRRELTAGDHVEFGSVEFIFAEGDQSIDPEQVAAGSANDKVGTYALIAVLMMAGLAIGGAGVFALFQLTQDDGEAAAEAVDPLQAEITDLLETGENQLRAGNWESADASFNEALDLAHGRPEQQRAQELSARVDLERKGAEHLAAGEQLSEQGRHSEARDELLQIPDDTHASRRAASTLEFLELTISDNLKNQANRMLRRGEDLEEAHKKIAEAHDIRPDDAEIAAVLDDIEAELEDQGLDFESARR